MNAESSLEKLKEIIRAIRNTPGIYNFKHDDFLVFERREQCWENVANSVNLRVEDLKSRWRVLRDRYVRYQRKLVLGRIDISEVRFPFFEQMKFLDPYIKRRNPKRIMNVSTNKVTSEKPIKTGYSYSEENTCNPIYNEESQDENMLMSLENTVNNHDNAEYLIESIDKPAENKNVNIMNEGFHSQETVFVDSGSPFDEEVNQKRRRIKLEQSVTNDLDEDDLFGKSLGLSLKKLSRLNNVRAKAEIFKVLQKYIEYEEIRDN